jgi:hypothetical protein
MLASHPLVVGPPIIPPDTNVVSREVVEKQRKPWLAMAYISRLDVGWIQRLNSTKRGQHTTYPVRSVNALKSDGSHHEE